MRRIITMFYTRNIHLRFSHAWVLFVTGAVPHHDHAGKEQDRALGPSLPGDIALGQDQGKQVPISVRQGCVWCVHVKMAGIC